MAVKSPSGVDSDDLTSTSTHEEDPIETFSKNLKELHVWETNSEGTWHSAVKHSTLQSSCLQTFCLMQPYNPAWTAIALDEHKE